MARAQFGRKWREKEVLMSKSERLGPSDESGAGEEGDHRCEGKQGCGEEKRLLLEKEKGRTPACQEKTLIE